MLSSSLVDDISAILNQIKINDSQTWRRLYVKSMVSVIETQIVFFKNHIILTGELDHLGLSESEEQILYKLKKDKSRVPKKRLSLLENIVFSLELFSSVNYSFITIDKKTKGYNNLVTLIKIRNRITHPSILADIKISDKEVKICELAFILFQNTLNEMLKKSAEALFQHAAILKNHIDNKKADKNSNK